MSLWINRFNALTSTSGHFTHAVSLWNVPASVNWLHCVQGSLFGVICTAGFTPQGRVTNTCPAVVHMKARHCVRLTKGAFKRSDQTNCKTLVKYLTTQLVWGGLVLLETRPVVQSTLFCFCCWVRWFALTCVREAMLRGVWKIIPVIYQGTMYVWKRLYLRTGPVMHKLQNELQIMFNTNLGPSVVLSAFLISLHPSPTDVWAPSRDGRYQWLTVSLWVK